MRPHQRHGHQPPPALPEMATVAAIVLLVCVAHVDSYPDAPPVSACSTMAPGHGGSSQTSTPPYVIAINGQATPSCYVPGQTVTVTLSGISGAKLKGFFMQARLPSDTTSYGVFATNGDTNATPLRCPGGTSFNAIGHNNGNAKTSVSFSWTPPSSLTGTITLTTTVVKDFSTYWIQGVTLSIAGCTTTAPTTSKTTTQPLVTTTRVATTPVATTRITTAPVMTTRVATTPVATTRITTAPVMTTRVATTTATMTSKTTTRRTVPTTRVATKAAPTTSKTTKRPPVTTRRVVTRAVPTTLKTTKRPPVPTRRTTTKAATRLTTRRRRRR